MEAAYSVETSRCIYLETPSCFGVCVTAATTATTVTSSPLALALAYTLYPA
jgi:hypothetical protein